jgi:acylpyruvate hydrolase
MDFVLNPFGTFARSVFCVGRNYVAHAKELGNAVPVEPVIFLKPASSLTRSGRKIILPPSSQQVDHEVELVVAMGGGGRGISEANALDFVAGYAIGIDVTARDLQDVAKKKQLPWTVSKGFDTFAPVSDFLPRAKLGDGPLEFTLTVNGEVRQRGNTSNMLFSVPKIIAHLSTIFTLSPGDLIFTGTPEGVGPLRAGDKLVAELGKGQATLEVTVDQ